MRKDSHKGKMILSPATEKARQQYDAITMRTIGSLIIVNTDGRSRTIESDNGLEALADSSEGRGKY